MYASRFFSWSSFASCSLKPLNSTDIKCSHARKSSFLEYCFSSHTLFFVESYVPGSFLYLSLNGCSFPASKIFPQVRWSVLCWTYALHLWKKLFSKETLSFNSSLFKKFVINVLPKKISEKESWEWSKIRFQIKKRTRCHKMNRNFHNTSHLKSKFLQGVKCSVEFFFENVRFSKKRYV